MRGQLCLLHVQACGGKLPEVIKLPASITVPFGSFEQALDASENADVKRRLEAAVSDIPESHAEEKLKACRDIVMEVRGRRFCPPAGL